MSTPAIQISGLGKRYRYGGATPLSYNLREDLVRWCKGLLKSKSGHHETLHEVREHHLTESPEFFWALKDIDLEIQPGEVVGIIGRNGAGKSTLLKILSRITPPTTGSITFRGRMASLLEVGTGFHRELSGRENIFLNGSILGMSRREIASKLDEIIAFAEVEKFIDTPVKFYSSGMYVRLAFAVAAHLEPEILVVDEVLAVGDAAFQKKCLGKMGDVARSGRTVLFVSHAMGTISKLCQRAVLLSNGMMLSHGDAREIVARYLDEAESEANQNCGFRKLSAKGYPFILHGFELLNASGKPARTLPNDSPFTVRITYEITQAMEALRVGFRLHARDGTTVLTSTDSDHLTDQSSSRTTGVFSTEVQFPAHFLNLGGYYFWIGIDVPMVAEVLSVDHVGAFVVEGTGGLAGVNDKRQGVVAPLFAWHSSRLRD